MRTVPSRTMDQESRRCRRLSWAFICGCVLAQLLSPLHAGSGPDAGSNGFAHPTPGRVFSFPRDHGSHPEFALEWWYLTGHLWETNGARYGFQATFFRRAAPRTSTPESPTSDAFGDQQLYLAHMALLEASTGRFLHQERLNREGWDAGSSTNALDVRNGNWWLRPLPDPPDSPAHPLNLELNGGIRAEASFRLTLTPRKPLVIFGTNGVSRKAAEPSAASHYLTFTRLAATGRLTLEGRERPVQGEVWMDHEISSSQLGSGQVGWDWAGIQLTDGREIMAYRMRRSDGSTDPFSTLTWVDRQGGGRAVGATAFEWKPEGEWKSPVSGAVYPARVRLTTRDPESGVDAVLVLEPIHPAQELNGALGGIAYWEGACRVRDARGREIGSAFLEMTGYAASMAGRL